MNRGKRAVTSGNVLEKNVEATLQAHGYFKFGHHFPKKNRLNYLLHSSYLPKRYARQVYIGMGIYDTDIYVDFFLVDATSTNSGIIIECKWQQTGGSVDEKLPYVNLNIQHCYPAPTIVLIDGYGMRPGAISWLEAQVATNQNLMAVHSLPSFIAWANNSL